MTRPQRIAFRLSSFIFEVTERCNHDCAHCYNVWKIPSRPGASLPGPRAPGEELSTRETLAMLDKMLRETGAELVTLTGGEPLLRGDLMEIVDFLVARAVTVNLISNGSLLDAVAIARFGADKISIFELPLLSCDRRTHDRMSGAAGAFDRVTMAIAELKAARQRVVGVFVATRLNLPQWRETAELGIALGLDGIMFNRFNPGGCGCAHVAELQTSPAELQAALDTAEEISGRYEISISCSIAMPPCLIDTSRYRRLGFGFCAAGTERAYYTLDPRGNVRPCNHSPRILGNIRRQSFAELAASDAMNDFCVARPAFCSRCRLERECQGGCKAAAEACSGSVLAMDPFLAAFAHDAVRQV